MEEKYLLVSLEDERAESISEVISNKTCKKILNFLTEKEASVSDIAENMNIPINTADYNVKKLVKAGFIEMKSSMWSIKGKKIPIYRVSNRKIIISQKKTTLGKLKNFTPALIVSAIFTLFLLFEDKLSLISENKGAVLSSSLESAAGDIARTMPSGVDLIAKASNVQSSFSITSYFLIGIWVALIAFVIFSIRSEK